MIPTIKLERFYSKNSHKLIAKCKEESPIEAAMNGHLVIWPESEIRFVGDWAYFYKKNKRIWKCNRDYAKAHFIIYKAIGKIK